MIAAAVSSLAAIMTNEQVNLLFKRMKLDKSDAHVLKDSWTNNIKVVNKPAIHLGGRKYH
jgi:hypothetical protein